MTRGINIANVVSVASVVSASVDSTVDITLLAWRTLLDMTRGINVANVVSVASVVSASVDSPVDITILARRMADWRRLSRFIRLGRVASPATTLPPSTTFLARRVASTSPAVASRPALKLSPAAAHVLHDTYNSSAFGVNGCSGRAAARRRTNTYTSMSVCYLLASVAKFCVRSFLPTPTSREGSIPCCHIWWGMPHRRAQRRLAYITAEMLSSRPHDDPYLDIFPFGAVMPQLPVREELRHQWPTYRTMYSTGGNSSRMLKA